MKLMKITCMAVLTIAGSLAAQVPDGVKIDDPRVRVLVGTDQPHHPTEMHEHPMNRVMIYLPTALSMLSAACTRGRPGLVHPVGRGPQRPVLPVWRQLASGKRQGMILAPPAGLALSRLCTVSRVRQPRQLGGNAVVPPLSADSLA